MTDFHDYGGDYTRHLRDTVGPKRDAGDAASEVEGVLAEIERAENSRDISMAMRKMVARKLVDLMSAGKVGAGDLVKLMALVNDRTDGKVVDRLEVKITTSDEAMAAVRMLVKDGVLTVDQGREELRAIGVAEDVIDAEFEVVDE